MPASRVAEVLAALSLTTDLATGMPFEKGLRVCLVADGLAAALDLEPPVRATLFTSALLYAVGCTAHAPENASWFEDDTAFQRAFHTLDPGDPEVFGTQLARFGEWGSAGNEMARTFLEIAPTVGPVATGTGCEVSERLAPVMTGSSDVVAALRHVYERYDGHGLPHGRSGAELPVVTRLLHVAEQGVLAAAGLDTPGRTGAAAARDEVRRRAGGQLDPVLAEAFAERAEELLAATAEPDLLEAVLGREPEPHQVAQGADLGRLAGVLGLVADLKSTHLVGHSAQVASLAGRAAAAGDLTAEETAAVVCAGHLHNLGCVVVPSAVLDRAAPLGVADRERLRLHGYWTRRILERCPSLRELEPLTRGAAAHHPAFAEGGYRGWERSPELPPARAVPRTARILEAAEAYAGWVEPRPGRGALAPAEVADRLRSAVAAGLLDGEAVDLVLAGSGRPPARRPAPSAPALSAREVEVLQLTARGLTNRQIAAELVISERTVGHHLAHVYDKTGLRTRAGVAVWAVEHGLLPPAPPG